MATGEKVDLYKLHKEEYVSPAKPTSVHVKKAQYLAVSGRGAPGSEAYQAKIAALYGVAYTANRLLSLSPATIITFP